MIDYRAGDWGLHVAFGVHGSLAPRALAMAVPNAMITLLVAWVVDNDKYASDHSKAAQVVIGAGTSVMIFILHNRSRTSYSRWWEGGTLLQKARGEWFNAYSSIMAFTSTKPELEQQVEQYMHFTARLMSLLMCCALQQVSPNRNRPFEIIGLDGFEPASMDFLNSAPDKVEIILQWIQRSMVLHMQTGVLPVAPPILSRAFQEVSRGIVNLQNARKIADFPYPFPLAQVSMILQLVHWAVTPIAASLAMPKPFAVLYSFCSIFVLWCIHFNALDLEFPFGTRVNDLPMNEFQQEWNKSISTLLHRRAQRPPVFDFRAAEHQHLCVAMSDASELYQPRMSLGTKSNRSTCARITIKTGDLTKVRKGFDDDDVKMLGEKLSMYSTNGPDHSTEIIAEKDTVFQLVRSLQNVDRSGTVVDNEPLAASEPLASEESYAAPRSRQSSTCTISQMSEVSHARVSHSSTTSSQRNAGMQIGRGALTQATQRVVGSSDVDVNPKISCEVAHI